MKLLYFAWLREKIGTGEEDLTPPASVRDVADLLGWLAGRSAGHAAALADRRAIRVAVNQVHVTSLATPVRPADEVALFPPVTGG